MSSEQDQAAAPAPEAPKRKFAKQVNQQPHVDPIVKCRVTARGADRISTGRHVDTLGDERYAFGEIFETELSNALSLRDGDEAYQMRFLKQMGYRDWIEIIEPLVPRNQLVRDDFEYGAQ